MANLHISISAEPVFHLGPLAITNSILTSLIVTTILVGISIWALKNIKYTKKPTGLQNFLEMVIEGLLGLTLSITESDKKTKAIFPFVLSFFLFILLNNWLGLLPGVGTIGFREPAESGGEAHATAPESVWVKPVQASETIEAQEVAPTQNAEEKGAFVPYFRAGTADLNTTLALALISVASTQIIGVKFQGFHYFSKFFNLKGPIDGFVGILETVSEISKIISFAFRLFGNVFAGEVLLAVIAFLIPVIVPMPFIGLEIFVGAVQAFVFATLTMVFMNLATQGHGSEAH